MKIKTFLYNLIIINLIIFFLNDYLHAFSIKTPLVYLVSFLLITGITTLLVSPIEHFFLIKHVYLNNILVLSVLLGTSFVLFEFILPGFTLQATTFFNYDISIFVTAYLFNFFVRFLFYLIYELK